MQQKPLILLLPPGGFDKSFFDFYLQKYAAELRDFEVVALDLPGRRSNSADPLRLDGKFVAEWVNSQGDRQRLVIMGMSTSVGAVIEALPLIGEGRVLSLCLIFGGEFVDRRLEILAKGWLWMLRSSYFGRFLFKIFAGMRFRAYREGKFDVKSLLHFYDKLIDWRLPKFHSNIRALILHARRDVLIDHDSRGKLEGLFARRKVLMVECSHQPSDSAGEAVFRALLEEVNYLLGIPVSHE